MKWFHRHRFKVTGAQQLARTTPLQRLKGNWSPVTEVLMTCDCGTVKTVCLDGHWTLEQLQPAPLTFEADQEFLRKLRVKL